MSIEAARSNTVALARWRFSGQARIAAATGGSAPARAAVFFCRWQKAGARRRVPFYTRGDAKETYKFGFYLKMAQNTERGSNRRFLIGGQAKARGVAAQCSANDDDVQIMWCGHFEDGTQTLQG